MVDRDGLNIVGLSESTLERLVDMGYIKKLSDIYHIKDYENEIKEWEGFGEKSCQKLLDAIEASRDATFAGFFYALSIPGCGHDAAKILKKSFSEYVGDSYVKWFEKYASDMDKLAALKGIGPVSAKAIYDWMSTNKDEYEALKAELTITDDIITEKKETSSGLSGKTFVITGSLTHFNNRDELKALIEEKGGKVSGSVSKNTTALINNDVTSESGKNKKAKSLNVKILSEDEFMQMFF